MVQRKCIFIDIKISNGYIRNTLFFHKHDLLFSSGWDCLIKHLFSASIVLNQINLFFIEYQLLLHKLLLYQFFFDVDVIVNEKLVHVVNRINKIKTKIKIYISTQAFDSFIS